MGLGEQFGHLGEPDAARAAAWYRFAARGEHPGALFNLQGLLRDDPDLAEASEDADALLRRARWRGTRGRSGPTGRRLLMGVVDDVPAAEGLAWLQLAADQGDATAAENLGRAEAAATSQEIEESRRLADEALGLAVDAADRSDLLLGYHAYLTEE